MSYLMQEATAGEIAAEDPFGGSGVFLESGLGSDEMLAELERAFGCLPGAVVWPQRGAWVKGDGTADSAAVITGKWAGR
jgi:hypothetical protein